MKPRPRASRKLLVASIGIATVSYVTATASCSSSGSVGNLMAYPTDGGSPVDDSGNAADASSSGGDEFIVGNLAPFPIDANMVEESVEDATRDAPQDAIDEFHPIVGNLAPPPSDR